jgi:hypothetical protein
LPASSSSLPRAIATPERAKRKGREEAGKGKGKGKGKGGRLHCFPTRARAFDAWAKKQDRIPY